MLAFTADGPELVTLAGAVFAALGTPVFALWKWFSGHIDRIQSAADASRADFASMMTATRGEFTAALDQDRTAARDERAAERAAFTGALERIEAKCHDMLEAANDASDRRTGELVNAIKWARERADQSSAIRRTREEEK